MNIRSISTLLCFTLALMVSTVSIPAQDSASLEMPAQPISEARPVKSHLVAYGWMAAGTIVPMVLVFGYEYGPMPVFLGGVGLVIGPSAGEFYAGAGTSAWAGIFLRGVGGGLAVYGVADCLNTMFSNSGCAEGLIYAGTGLAAIGMLYSLIDTKAAVDRANGRTRMAPVTRMSLSPTLLRNREGRFSPGISLMRSF